MHRSSPTRRFRGHDTAALVGCQHVGLVYDKLVPHSHDGDKEATSRFVGAMAERVGMPGSYPASFQRWVKRTLEQRDGPWQRRVAVVHSQGRVLCGLGELTPTENGLSIHTTYGVPYLPGSSLKGIAKAWLAGEGTGPWSPGGGRFIDAFGMASDEEDGGRSGVVHFLDALWIPGDPASPDKPWAAEILTPHFAGYYKDGVAPDGTEDPVPVVFLGAQGAFRLVLEGPPELVDEAIEHLCAALLHRGVGAKGRAGYGRFTRDPRLTRDDLAEAEAQAAVGETRRLERKLAATGTVGAALDAIRELEPGRNLGADLQHWLSRSEALDPRLARFHLTPQAAVEAFAWAHRNHLVKGLLAKVRGDLAPEILAALEGDQPAPTPSGFGPNHLAAFEDPTGLRGSKKKKWPNAFSSQIARGRYDEDTVTRALAHLERHGGRQGHLDTIRRAYGLDVGVAQ